MIVELKLELQNVYGGDGFTRLEQVKDSKLKRTKKHTTTRRDIGVPVESETDEVKTEMKDENVHTFKKENGNYLLRLGGAHGKLWGALRSAGHLLADTGEMKSKAFVDRIMDAILVTPEWAMLENSSEVKTVQLAQKMNTMGGKSMVFPLFDVIPTCNTTMTLRYPDEYEQFVRKMLGFMQSMNSLNKRRGTIKIVSEAVVS